MADDDERLTVVPAPLPRHERAWRHPSEIGQQRRAGSRCSAPPLSPFVTCLAGLLGLGLVASLVALVIPREAPREALPSVRNATVSTPWKQPADVTPTPVFPTVDESRFVVGFVAGLEDGSDNLFVTTGQSGAIIANIGGRLVPLRVVAFDGNLGISVLRADAQVDGPAPFATSTMAPVVGSHVRVGSNETVDASVGVSVMFDTTTFVPLAGDVLTADVPESSPVKDNEGRLVGLFTRRSGAVGFVPIAALDELLSRLR